MRSIQTNNKIVMDFSFILTQIPIIRLVEYSQFSGTTLINLEENVRT